MGIITIEQLKDFLKSGNFKLQPTQNKLCYPIIRRICHKMNAGVHFENINVDKELLINGHHRYICSQCLKKSININLWSSPFKVTAYKWLNGGLSTSTIMIGKQKSSLNAIIWRMHLKAVWPSNI